ncbi:hypothetical protein ES705_45135 [subsurface metagenome]
MADCIACFDIDTDINDYFTLYEGLVSDLNKKILFELLLQYSDSLPAKFIKNNSK